MSDMIIGLDIGTTSTKAVLFDLSGAELATAEQAYRLKTPHAGWVEQDPDSVWAATITVLRSIADRATDRNRILALGLAAQSGSLLPADSDGTPVSPIITWMDGRTEALVERWKQDGVEERVRRISGWHLYPGLCLPTIAWLRRHQPDTFAAAERYCSVNDFLVHRLTGRYCTNPSNAGGMQLVDITGGEWSPEMCTLAGIDTNMLSPIRASGVTIGRLTAEVSRLTGLPSDTVVVNGGHDQGCTALGLGVTTPGRILLACGTAWVVTGVTESPDVDMLPDRLDMNFLPVPERWTVSQSLGGLGASMEWLLHQCWRSSDSDSTAGRTDRFATLDDELQGTTPGGSGLFFRPLTGGHSAPAGDQTGGVVGLRLDHTRADMARAVMEGAAFELRLALDQIRRSGMPITDMWMIGGAGQSSIWPDIVANVTGVPLTLPRYKHWPAVGAAILAGVGIGAFRTVEEGQARFQRAACQIEPRWDEMGIYDENLALYQKVAYLVTQGGEGEEEIR
jgi:xylulokinase